MKIERSVKIDRPNEDVFAFIRDPNNDPIWCPTVQESSQVTGTGPNVGAVYKQVHKPGPAKPTELTVELLEIDAPSYLRQRSVDELAIFDVTYRLESLANGGTQLTQTDDARFQGFAKLLQPIMWFAIHSGIKRQFRQLKDQLEADRNVAGASGD